jgi:signal transduction histidine kinase
MENDKAVRRIRELSNITLDVTQRDELLQDFSSLLTLISGAKFSQVNIFDHDMQYTIASDGALFPPLPKRSTFCRYTLDQKSSLEIPDMTKDDRLKDHFAVTGEPFAQYYFGAPLITQNDVAIGTVCIIHDHKLELSETQREAINTIAKQITRHLELQNKIVENDKIIEDQSSTLHKIVHDLRSPMSAILGNLSMVDKDQLNDELKKLFTQIKSSCREMVDYINETLEDTLQETDNSSTFITASTLEEKLRSLYDLQAKEKDITLDIDNDLDEDEQITTLSSGDLINISGNIISNAIKYTPENSRVSVHLTYRDSDKDKYKLTVTDNGPGMGVEQLEKINAHERTDSEDGYGIGLYEALRTLKNHDGSFKIDTRQGEGTRFTVFFPRKHS